MIFTPSENPGAFERHLIRRANPLFGERQTDISSDTLMEVQKKDHDILQQFMLDFREVMSKVVSFKPNEESEVILEAKDKLEKLYASSISVADDQIRVSESIKKLIAVIMQSIRKSAGDDVKAQQELDQEEMAREAHYELLKSKLVADILDPDSPIENEDLIPTLLTADKEDLVLATQLFDLDQLNFLLSEADKLLDQLVKKDVDLTQAKENYAFMEGYKLFIENEMS